MTYHVSVRWVQDKAIVQADFTLTAGDGKIAHGCWNFGWDAVNKKIMYSGFDSVGGRVWGALKKEDPSKWIWENNSANVDGTQGSGTDVTTMLDNNNTHVHEFTNRIVDGKPQPDGKLVYKRVK